MVFLYSCADEVKSTDASLRLLSLKATANMTVKYDTHTHTHAEQTDLTGTYRDGG